MNTRGRCIGKWEHLRLPDPADTAAVLSECPVRCLLQESERAGTVERLAALFAGVAFFERIGVANNPALLRHGLLYSGSGTSHGNAVEAALLGPKVSTERLR